MVLGLDPGHPALARRYRNPRGVAVLKILIVEDEALLAETLRRLIELNPQYEVTGTADDLTSALAAVERRRPDLALVDLQLANATSGYSVAARLHDLGIACLFTTGRAPGFQLPDLALGCLEKPFREEHLVRALSEAEDILRGRQKLVLKRRLPDQLQLYSPQPADVRHPSAGFRPRAAEPPLPHGCGSWSAALRPSEARLDGNASVQHLSIP